MTPRNFKDDGSISSFYEQIKLVEHFAKPSLCCTLEPWISCKNCDWKLCEECMKLGRPANMYHYATFLSHEKYGCKENFESELF